MRPTTSASSMARPTPRHAARPVPSSIKWPRLPPPDQAIGVVSRTTKIHMTVDSRGRPLSLHLTRRNTSDTTELEAVLDGIAVPRTVGLSCPQVLVDGGGADAEGVGDCVDIERVEAGRFARPVGHPK
jgi:hypothetical protein